MHMDDLRHSFEEAFEAYSDELFRHASIRLSDRERAMELTQETFMKTWAYAQKGAARFSPAICSAASHTCTSERPWNAMISGHNETGASGAKLSSSASRR